MLKKNRKVLIWFLALFVFLGSFSAWPISALAAGIPPASDAADVPGLDGLIAAGIDMSAEGVLPLKDVFEDHFLIGSGFTSNEASGIYFEHLKKHFNALTPGNETKPGVIWRNPNNPLPASAFNTPNNMFNKANESGIYTIGHALAWHNQSERWPDRDKDRPTWNASTGLFTPIVHYWG